MSSNAVHAEPSATTPVVHRPDLFGARSVVGALAVVAVLTLFGVGMQAAADWVRNASGFEVGQPQAVTDTVAFTPAAGWVNDPAQTVPGLGVVAHKNGWELKVAAGITLQPGQTVEDFATILHDVPPSEPGAQVSELATVTTTSGLHGVTWKVHGTTVTTMTWMITDGQQVTQMLVTGPSDTLDSVEDDVRAMASSVTMAAKDAG